jgi:leucyl-tRNA synthetase
MSRLVAKMGTYVTETRNGFEATLAWLNQWACARTFGLGTRLPWDQQFIVESLSDSTIYMAYYTFAHYLQGGVIDGSKPGSLNITPDQLSDEFFDWLLCGEAWPENTTIPREKADLMKHEFEYFYPFDVRSSGKDLIPNHLTFAVYTHAAIFKEEYWPLNMRTNGHLMMNGEKMSKNKGNFLTMRDAVNKFGADATRLSLADAGDGIEDANFDEKTANANILRLHTLIAWCEVRKCSIMLTNQSLIFYRRSLSPTSPNFAPVLVPTTTRCSRRRPTSLSTSPRRSTRRECFCSSLHAKKLSVLQDILQGGTQVRLL